MTYCQLEIKEYISVKFWNLIVFIQENALKMSSAKWRPLCVGRNVFKRDSWKQDEILIKLSPLGNICHLDFKNYVLNNSPTNCTNYNEMYQMGSLFQLWTMLYFHKICCSWHWNYPNQLWPRFMISYGMVRPQWIKFNLSFDLKLSFDSANGWIMVITSLISRPQITASISVFVS